MHSIKDILQLSTAFLQDKGIENPRRGAEDVVSTALGIKRLQLYLDFDKPVTEEELLRCRSVLKRFSQGEPIAHIQGFVEFFNCKIFVTKDVLIPRQETEILASMIAKEPLENQSLLDLCTGSGCLAISLKKRFPTLKVTATDISTEALAIAKKNALENEVEINFINGDFLSCVNEKFNYIVCNPPYISEEEFKGLDKSVSHFEPKQALVAPDNGLAFYKKLSLEAEKFLYSDGKLFLEIGCSQGPVVQSYFSHWSSCRLEKDWSAQDRFLLLKI